MNTNSNNTNYPINNSSKENIDEIDLVKIFQSIVRKKKIFFLTTFATVSLSIVYSFLKSPTWEGNFQIVLSKDSDQFSKMNLDLLNNPAISQFIGSTGKGSDSKNLETEVKILESPYVLNPVFDFVKQYRSKKGVEVEGLKFDNWKRRLQIELEDGTSVLNLSYKDKDKELVIPVIKLISNQYQEYSSEERDSGLARAIDYLDKQINIYRTKSVISIKDVEDFSILHRLTPFNNTMEDENKFSSYLLKIEEEEVLARNSIQYLEEQLLQFNSLGEDSEALMYLGSTLPEVKKLGLPNRLRKLEEELSFLRSVYKEDNIEITSLLLEKETLIKTLRRMTKGYLQAKIINQKAILASTKRPDGVISKYKELLRIAARDSQTLNQLEGEIHLLRLESYREEKPWELISEPTLKSKPVSPQKLNLILLGLFGGSLIGAFLSLFYDFKSGLIFHIDDFKKYLPFPLLKQLSINSVSSLNLTADFIVQKYFSDNNSTAFFIPSKELPKEINAFYSKFEEYLINRSNIKIYDNIEDIRTISNVILITSPGFIKRIQLDNIQQLFKLNNISVIGWLYIDPEYKI